MKRGFTLVELVIALCFLVTVCLLLAVGVPVAFKVIKLAWAWGMS